MAQTKAQMIEIPASALAAVIKGQEFGLDLGAIPKDKVAEIVLGLARKGFQETVSDAAAGQKDDDAKLKAMNDRAGKLQAGDYAFGAGNGGGALSEVDREMIEIMVKRYREHTKVKATELRKGIKEQTLRPFADKFAQALKVKPEDYWAELRETAEGIVATRKAQGEKPSEALKMDMSDLLGG